MSLHHRYYRRRLSGAGCVLRSQTARSDRGRVREPKASVSLSAIDGTERSICRRCFRSSAGERTPVLLRVRVAVSQNRATENNRCPGCLMTRRNRITPWCSAVAAGFVGTTTMSGTPWLERRVRHHLQKPVDCDASSHVVQAASTLLRIDSGGAGRRRALFLLVHWGYGSAVGVGYRGIGEVVGNDARAASMFYGACQGMAFVLFPTLGGTPSPWRSRRHAGLLARSARRVCGGGGREAASEQVRGPTRHVTSVAPAASCAVGLNST